jgi:prepilin-type N-terminal cleavage/methylation domain-containing protein
VVLPALYSWFDPETRHGDEEERAERRDKEREPSTEPQPDSGHAALVSKRRPAESGFSLIEMLVTLAILVILVVMTTSSGSKGFQRQQKEACRQHLQTLYVGLGLYAGDHEGRFPALTNAVSPETPLALLMPQYVSTTEPFICPGTKKDPIPEGVPLTKRRISYAYYMGRSSSDATLPLLSDAQLDSGAKEAGQRVFSKDGSGPGNNHHRYGGNILFGDGRTEETGAETSFALPTGPGVILLNPSP